MFVLQCLEGVRSDHKVAVEYIRQLAGHHEVIRQVVLGDLQTDTVTMVSKELRVKLDPDLTFTVTKLLSLIESYCPTLESDMTIARSQADISDTLTNIVIQHTQVCYI